MTEAVEREKKGYESLVAKYNAAKTDKEKELIENQIKDIQAGLKIKAHNIGIGEKWKLPVGMDWRPNNPTQAAAQGASYVNDAAQEAAKNHKQAETSSDGRKIIYFEQKKDGVIVDGKWFKNNREAQRYYPLKDYVYRKK